jgi:hypothetical protein
MFDVILGCGQQAGFVGRYTHGGEPHRLDNRQQVVVFEQDL